MTVREENGHANHRHDIRDALPAFQAAEEIFPTPVITSVTDEAAQETLLGNLNGAAHAPGEE
jgi:hypothetical protein